MAVLGFVTVQHVPFPVRVQRRTLEPDGLAFFSLKTEGDASGGNVLITVRSDTNEFFYVLKSISLRVNISAANPGPVGIIWNPDWIEDLSAFSQVFNLELFSAVTETTTQNWRMQTRDVEGAIAAGLTMPMGKVKALTSATQNVMIFNWKTNTNGGDYFSQGIFYAYRKEALTVPGFLDALVRPALIR